MNVLARAAIGLLALCIVLRIVASLVVPVLPMLGVIGLFVLVGALVFRGPRSGGGLFHR
jgi:hypothetical protein